jgi:hypothetical protein
MKTEFEHNFKIGEIAYSTRYMRVEELEVAGICYDEFFDDDINKNRKNVSYRLDGNFYVNENELFLTREAAEKHLGIGTRKHLEQQIAAAENHIRNNESLIKDCRNKLANLP